LNEDHGHVLAEKIGWAIDHRKELIACAKQKLGECSASAMPQVKTYRLVPALVLATYYDGDLDGVLVASGYGPKPVGGCVVGKVKDSPMEKSTNVSMLVFVLALSCTLSCLQPFFLWLVGQTRLDGRFANVDNGFTAGIAAPAEYKTPMRPALSPLGATNSEADEDGASFASAVSNLSDRSSCGSLATVYPPSQDNTNESIAAAERVVPVIQTLSGGNDVASSAVVAVQTQAGPIPTNGWPFEYRHEEERKWPYFIVVGNAVRVPPTKKNNPRENCTRALKLKGQTCHNH
jgi:hypothetical protein